MKANLRRFLESEGMLGSYVEAALKDMDTTFQHVWNPEHWVSDVFLWEIIMEDDKAISALNRRWLDLLAKSDGEPESGMPLDDELGLRLLLEELEDRK